MKLLFPHISQAQIYVIYTFSFSPKEAALNLFEGPAVFLFSAHIFSFTFNNFFLPVY